MTWTIEFDTPDLPILCHSPSNLGMTLFPDVVAALRSVDGPDPLPLVGILRRIASAAGNDAHYERALRTDGRSNEDQMEEIRGLLASLEREDE